MVPLGVRIAAFFSVPMVVATSASAEEKKKAAPPQSRQSRVMFAIGKRTRRGHALGRRLTRRRLSAGPLCSRQCGHSAQRGQDLLRT